MDGVGETQFAFAGNASNVTVSGIEIKNYTGGFQQGAIDAVGSGWTIDDCNVHDNNRYGISIRGGSTISGSNVHHNGDGGIMVNGGINATIDNNEIAFNNDDQTSGDFYVAGGKFLATSGLTVTNNNVHNNHGYGLWTYKDNINTVYRGNTIEDNWWGGISHDQSYAVTIDDNDFTNNGFKAAGLTGDNLYYGAVQITGPNATVTDNRLDDNLNGIVVIGYNLDSLIGAHGVLTPNNTTVTGNSIIDSGNNGIILSGSTIPVDTAEFDYNDYQYTDAAARHWVWNRSKYEWTPWRDVGNDLKGSLTSS